MTYYRCTTCNRPILFREWTDYGRQCKKCGEPVKASVKAKVVPHATWRPQFRKVDPIKPEEEMSLRDVKELVNDMQHRLQKVGKDVGLIEERLIRLLKELDK